MDAIQNGPKVDVRGLGIPQGVLDRAEVMLVAALQEADVNEGDFRLDADGPCGRLLHHSLPYLEVQPSPQIPNALTVQLKATGKPEGAIKGMLRLPAHVDRRKLLTNLAPGIENFNKDGWRDVLKEVSPGPPPDKVSAVSKGNGHDKTASPVSSSSVLVTAPVLAGIGGHHSTPVPHPASPQATTLLPALVKSSGAAKTPHEVHARFLKRLLEGHTDGTFSGKGVAQVSRQFFPDKSPRWLATGVLGELTGLGWIRHIGKGLYQVERSFVTEHRLIGLNLVPQPKYVRGNKRNGKSEETGHRGASKSNDVSVLGVPDLLRQRKIIDDQLLEKKRELDAAVIMAEQALVVARTNLSDFVQLLGPAASQLLTG